MRKIHHVCIQTNNYKASLDFYTHILGFKVIQETKDFHNRAYNTWIEQDGFMIELQTGKKEDLLINVNSKSEGLVHMCFLVKDVQQEVKRILNLGYKHFKLKNNNEIYEVEGSALSKVIAPEGTIIELRDIADL